MFQIGDKVRFTKTADGLHVGRIIGIYLPEMNPSILKSYEVWDETFGKDWIKKPIIAIKLDEPKKPVSYSECLKYYDFDDEKAKIVYENIANVTQISCPIDGVELLEEAIYGDDTFVSRT